jgi:hypothetical protein
LEKECDKMVQKACQNLTMLNAHVLFVFESLVLSFQKVNPLGEEKSITFGKQFWLTPTNVLLLFDITEHKDPIQ